MENELEEDTTVKPLKVVHARVMGEADYQVLVARAEKAEAELAALYKLYEDACLTITQDEYAYEVDRQVLESELAALREQTRWIPVSERLPDFYKSVIIRCGDGYTVISQRAQSGKQERYNFPFNDVTHWMPLSPPPEEE